MCIFQQKNIDLCFTVMELRHRKLNSGFRTLREKSFRTSSPILRCLSVFARTILRQIKQLVVSALTWNCLGRGYEYCQVNLLKDCSDVFGGFQCKNCLNGSEIDPTDETRCTGNDLVAMAKASIAWSTLAFCGNELAIFSHIIFKSLLYNFHHF